MIKCPRCKFEYYELKDPICACGFNLAAGPGSIEKIINFVPAVVKHVVGGMVHVSDSIKKERMEICKACPFFNNKNEKNPTCNACGCYLNEKTSWASEKCPEGKWHDIKTASNGGCGCQTT